jgi:hypothetical protein
MWGVRDILTCHHGSIVSPRGTRCGERRSSGCSSWSLSVHFSSIHFSRMLLTGLSRINLEYTRHSGISDSREPLQVENSSGERKNYTSRSMLPHLEANAGVTRHSGSPLFAITTDRKHCEERHWTSESPGRSFGVEGVLQPEYHDEDLA